MTETSVFAQIRYEPPADGVARILHQMGVDPSGAKRRNRSRPA